MTSFAKMLKSFLFERFLHVILLICSYFFSDTIFCCRHAAVACYPPTLSETYILIVINIDNKYL